MRYLVSIAIILIIIYLVSVFISKDVFIQFLNNNLPFRESYSPSLAGLIYVYLVPLLFGFLIGGIFSNFKTRSYIFFVNLGLIMSLINFIPFISDQYLTQKYWFQNHSEIFYLIIYPIIFLVGSAPFYIKGIKAKENRVEKQSSVNKLDLLIALLLGIFLMSLNLIPSTITNYMVGADVYYHVSLTRDIADTFNIRANPFFYQEQNFYYSIVYYFIAIISKLTNLDVKTIWLFLPAICAGLFIAFFYLFAKRFTGNSLSAVIASLFVLPLNQILWVDPSVRNFSYTFFAIFLFSFQSFLLFHKKRALAISIFFFLMTGASHPEIAIHIFIIMICFFMLIKWRFLKYLLSRVKDKFKNAEIVNFSNLPLKSLESFNTFLGLMFIIFFLLVAKYSLLLNNYRIDKILIFNEIPLSVFQPIGIISLLVFLFAPIAIFRSIKTSSVMDIFLLTISSLFLSVIFYFSYAWVLYHRYFAETAYLAMAILSAEVIAGYQQNLKRLKRLGFLVLILFLVFLSIIPKYNFITTYATTTKNNLESRAGDFKLIQDHTEKGSVLFLSSDDQLNRYIPLYADRYIFAGSSMISKEHQWQVLSFCNGPFAKICNIRLELSDDFFNYPSKDKLANIRGMYKIDYLLLKKTDLNQLNKFQSSDLRIQNLTLFQNENYLLYSLRDI
ncbi:hypothetical protein HY025_03685 [Candidatus Daviesbacteria bacterium]|nr:hypothetical protein [Candidatus Daviesbacteria bacterium]